MENRERKIRSFVLRQGRMTKGQQLAFERSWDRFGIDYIEKEINIVELFQNKNKQLVLEIGFGNGKSLAEMASKSPEKNFIGAEVHRPGVGSLLLEIEKARLENVRCINHDVIEVLQNMIPDNSLDTVQLFFPDPWPKKRHHKRRIVNQEFLALISRKLKKGGVFHMATDWIPYAEDAMEELSAFKGLENTLSGKRFAPRPDYRPKTKFEERGERLGHEVSDLVFRKPDSD